MTEDRPEDIARAIADMKSPERNPVHYVDAPFKELDSEIERLAGWYFWDETWAHRAGPYPTEADANIACEAYARWLDSPDRDTLENLGVDVL